MLKRLRAHLTFANLVSLTALFVALGGVAWALATDSVKSKHIKDGQVKSQDLNDAVESRAFTYLAATGDDVQEEMLNSDGYVFTAECANVSGRPSLSFFLEFPEDGRLAGFGISDPSDALGTASAGQGVDVVGGTPFESGALTAPAGESEVFGTTFIYTADAESALVTLHSVANDDDDQCRMAGMLVPGIIPPA